MDRKRIVELIHECTTEPYQFDEYWIARFMKRLHEEAPDLAKAMQKTAAKRLEELEMKNERPHP